MNIALYYALRFAALFNKNEVNVPQGDLTNDTVSNVLKAVFGFAGGIALIMVVIGGLRYINSLGNPQNVAKAKDTILYAVIGLVVCILGFAIVSFVIQKVS